MNTNIDGGPSGGGVTDVGVLLVHGIGEQPRGDTLIRFADPLIRWLDRWVSRKRPHAGTGLPQDSDGSVRVTTGELPSAGVKPDEPAHVRVAIDAGSSASGGGPPMTWLLAESWWAGDFQRPPFGVLALWMISRGSWMILSHFGKSARRAWNAYADAGGRLKLRRAWSALVALVLVIASVVLVLLLELIVGALALLNIIPIPQLRSALSGILLKITGSIGDSYVLLESPVQEAAAVDRVRRDLAWLARSGCRRIVVAAHSQGAAVVHRVLRGSAAPEVHTLVTFGSGLGKLEELRLYKRRAPHYFSIATFAVPLLAAAILINNYFATGAISSENRNVLRIVTLLYPLMFLVAAIGLAVDPRKTYFTAISNLTLSAVRPNLKWLDVFSSADPVPNGPLAEHEGEVAGVESHRIVNRMSALDDHNAYWANRDQFVPLVLQAIDAVCPTPLFGPDDRAELAARAALRPRRVALRKAFDAVSAACVVAMTFSLRGDLAWFGQHGILDLLRKIPLIEAVPYLLEGFGTFLAAGFRLTTGASLPSPHEWGVWLLGSCALAAAVMLWNRLLTAGMWNWMDRCAANRLFDPAAFPRSPSDQVLLGVLVGFVGCLPAVFTTISVFVESARRAGEMLFGGLLSVGAGLFVLILALGVAHSALGKLRELYQTLVGSLKRRPAEKK